MDKLFDFFMNVILFYVAIGYSPNSRPNSVKLFVYNLLHSTCSLHIFIILFVTTRGDVVRDSVSSQIYAIRVTYV